MQDSISEEHNLTKISIVTITPEMSQDVVFSLGQCYIGISLENPVFHSGALETLLLWGTQNFRQCLVVTGDYLLRFNERIFNGLADEAACEAAQRAGDEFLLETRDLFQRLDNQRISFVRWKPCLQSRQYRESKAILDKLFADDSDFRASVQRDAFSFIRRQAKANRSFAISKEQAIELSCCYLLEEMAVFSALSEQGWRVELYPGPELKVLVDIAKGKYLNVPNGLKHRVNVELRISGG